MKREILFKAKRKDNNEWVYGYLVKENDKFYITENTDQFYQVIPETVSQCIGLKDKNGVKIFENDIVKCKDYDGIMHEEIVYWVEEDGYMRCAYHPLCDNYFDCGLNYDDFEVIGNIFDEEVK